MQNKHPAMREIWLINAIQNALHEPNCLMQQHLDNSKAFCDLLKKEKFDPKEFEFIETELRTALVRLSESRRLVQSAESSLDEMLRVLEGD